MSGKRSRNKGKAGERELPPMVRVYWSKKERDIMVNWDAGCTSASANYIMCRFPQYVIDELDKRGYDITTLRFQIRKKSITEGQGE